MSLQDKASGSERNFEVSTGKFTTAALRRRRSGIRIPSGAPGFGRTQGRGQSKLADTLGDAPALAIERPRRIRTTLRCFGASERPARLPCEWSGSMDFGEPFSNASLGICLTERRSLINHFVQLTLRWPRKGWDVVAQESRACSRPLIRRS